MSVDIQTISETSELAELIQEAEVAGRVPRIQIGNARYTIVREDRTNDSTPQDYDPPLVTDPSRIWENYDPDRVIEALNASAGAFKGIDREQLLADLAEQRRQDSVGRPEV